MIQRRVYGLQKMKRKVIHMLIDFSSSGGFANLALAYRVDTNTLPEEQAKELESLVESSEVFNLEQDDTTPQPEAAAGPPDVIAYRLTVSDGGRQRTIWFNDVNAPASVRPLLTKLRTLALEQRKKAE
jgi:hypothetical protein